MRCKIRKLLYHDCKLWEEESQAVPQEYQICVVCAIYPQCQRLVRPTNALNAYSKKLLPNE